MALATADLVWNPNDIEADKSIAYFSEALRAAHYEPVQNTGDVDSIQLRVEGKTYSGIKDVSSKVDRLLRGVPD